MHCLSLTSRDKGRDGDHHLTKLFRCVCWWLTQSIFVSGQLILFWAAGKVYCYSTVNSVNVTLSHLTFERWPNDCRHQVRAGDLQTFVVMSNSSKMGLYSALNMILYTENISVTLQIEIFFVSVWALLIPWLPLLPVNGIFCHKVFYWAVSWINHDTRKGT